MADDKDQTQPGPTPIERLAALEKTVAGLSAEWEDFKTNPSAVRVGLFSTPPAPEPQSEKATAKVGSGG